MVFYVVWINLVVRANAGRLFLGLSTTVIHNVVRSIPKVVCG